MSEHYTHDSILLCGIVRQRRQSLRLLQHMKLVYLDEIAIPKAHVELVHMMNPRVRSTCEAIEYLKQHPHFLDQFRGTSPQDTIYGIVCDLAILPNNPRLARLLSLKRASAMTTVITRDIATILETKKRIAELRTACPNITHTTAFYSAALCGSGDSLCVCSSI